MQQGCEVSLLMCCSMAMGCLFVDREKGDGGKQINKEVGSSRACGVSEPC